MVISVNPLSPSNRSEWEVLAREYNAFYQSAKTSEDYDSAWARLMKENEVHGLAAKSGDKIVGIAHILFHGSTWATRVCYLQDLYTSPDARGNGVARALITAAAHRARSDGASRFYWLTRENNAVARVLYAKMAKYNGFIRYEYPINDEA